MDRFVRVGRVLRSRRAAAPDAPDETVLELGDNDSIEVTVVEAEPPTTAAPDGSAGRGGTSSPIPAEPDRRWWRPRAQEVRLAALVTVIVLVVLVSVAAVRRAQDPTIDELRDRAGWSDLDRLRVGVSGDVPFLSDCETKAPECTGFDVEIAKLVAAWLGLRSSQIDFAEVLPEDRERMQGRDFVTNRRVHVDLVVAAFSITPFRTDVEKVVFAGPYLNTQTTVLTRKDHPPVESLSALDGPITVDGKVRERQKVCTPGTTTSRDYLRRETTAEIIPLQRNSECVRRLLNKEVDAAVTDAAILAGFQAKHADRLKLNNIASTDDEHWGIGIGQDMTGNDEKIQARRQLVLLALNDLLTAPAQEGWRDAFDLLPPTPTTPGVDVQVVADDQQPTPWGLEPVRRWPWERSGSGSGSGE